MVISPDNSPLRFVYLWRDTQAALAEAFLMRLRLALYLFSALG